ncbi:MAG: hypothetical protein IH788_00945, partial [Nitrospinae bacterium]|nr:hypothetical protein [Nitrospinota bacterium]
MTILEKIRARASHLSRRVVLPEGGEERTVEAAARIASQGIARPLLLGAEVEIVAMAGRLGVTLHGVEIVDPSTSPRRLAFEERLFGLTGSHHQRKTANEGNHGEDVKEYYYYLDSTPTHSYMKMLYKYPQCAFPYGQLVEENKQRGKDLPEVELIDTGIFDEDRYFDIFVEYAKVDTDDLLVKITAKNHGPDEAELHIVPQLWFRNTWSWDPTAKKPAIHCDAGSIKAENTHIGTYHLYTEKSHETIFTENETNVARLYGQEASGFFKDGINDYIVNEKKTAVNPEQFGTKAAVICRTAIPAGAFHTIRLRLSSTPIDTP